MTHIKITKGLDIPIKGFPEGKIKPFVRGGESSPQHAPTHIALNLKDFEDLKLRLLVKPDDIVKIGQPLVEDKTCPGRFFVSPAGGTVVDVRRGAKRVLEAIIIQIDEKEETHTHSPLNPHQATVEQIIDRLKEGGLFAHIRQRPFNLLADPARAPRAIFVKAIESAPFTPPAELQVAGHAKDFQIGLDALAKLTSGSVHLVYRQGTSEKAFTEAKNVIHHTAEGPHPIANQSLHIQKIDPIRSPDDVLWTVSARDVVAIGHLLNSGTYLTERIISIAGPAFLPDRTGYFKVREGYPISLLFSDRLEKGPNRLISGDPLTGHQVTNDDFLGFRDFVFCAFRENTERELLHFFRLGPSKFTASRAYLSGHLDKSRLYDFTTNQHGEHRAFIDSTLYDKVQPLHVPTMLLVKAVMAEDYELAETYGLLDVDSEDFALPTFVDPSKIEMTEIVKKGLKRFAQEVLQ